MSEKIICQYCDNSYSEKVKYCPFCGAENVKEITETIPQCPRCNIEMEEESFRGSVIDISPKCSGIWLDGDEFRYHTSARDIYPDKKIPRNFRREPLSEERKYLPCVRCKKLMHRENFRRISSVLIDKCPAHGVWLDAGELEQIDKRNLLEYLTGLQVTLTQTNSSEKFLLETQDLGIHQKDPLL